MMGSEDAWRNRRPYEVAKNKSANFQQRLAKKV